MSKENHYRAFIFDDEEDMCKILSEIVKMRGYEVFTFCNPSMFPNYKKQSCACPSNYACTDVIISDIQMPIASGLDFVEGQIEMGCKCPNIAIMSGSWNETDYERAKKIDCKILRKPFSIDDLVWWLEDVEKNIDPERILSDWREEGCFST